MRHTLISQFTGQVLKLNPCSKLSEAPGPLYFSAAVSPWPHSNVTPKLESLTSQLFRRRRSMHISWGTGGDLVLHWTCGTLWYAAPEPSLCPQEMALWREKRVGLRNEAPVWSAHPMACCLMRRAVNPSNPAVHCSFSLMYLLLITSLHGWKGSAFQSVDAP